ncbi:hypothetical protein ABKY54_004163 [Vibrio harveyi]
MEQFITAKEIIKSLGVSYSGFNNMVKEGSFPKPDVGGEQGSTRRWKESTYKNWCDGRGGNGDSLNT